MEVLPDEAPLEALVIGFPGDRATGEGDEAASDPETVVPDEHTATRAKFQRSHQCLSYPLRFWIKGTGLNKGRGGLEGGLGASKSNKLCEL